MVVLTAKERVIWAALRNRARAASPNDADRSCISYNELGHQVDPDGLWKGQPMTRPPFRGLNIALGHISRYEHEHGRPLLSSLVVNQDSGEPGSGFAAEFGQLRGGNVVDHTAFWREELTRTIDFWLARDDMLIFDEAVERLLAELAAIRKLITEKEA